MWTARHPYWHWQESCLLAILICIGCGVVASRAKVRYPSFESVSVSYFPRLIKDPLPEFPRRRTTTAGRDATFASACSHEWDSAVYCPESGKFAVPPDPVN